MPVHFDTTSQATINNLLSNHLIFQAQVDSMLEYPEQGHLGTLTAGAFQGQHVYHIEGRYPNVGKPLWTYNRQTQTIHFLGMYDEDEESHHYIKRLGTGDGPNRI